MFKLHFAETQGIYINFQHAALCPDEISCNTGSSQKHFSVAN